MESNYTGKMYFVQDFKSLRLLISVEVIIFSQKRVYTNASKISCQKHLINCSANSVWIGREARPIFLGPKILSRLIFLDLVFCLFKIIFLGSHLVENVYFWIHLACNKSELNEKILNERLSRPC